jgi:succinate dehydrogenase/fumarate reductase-like Fe-S protein
MSRILHKQPRSPEGSLTSVHILRSDPLSGKSPALQTYQVALSEAVTALELLRIIYEQIDPTLAFRNQECNQGICGVCRIKMTIDAGSQQADARAGKACRSIIQPGTTVSMQPVDMNKVIRDLVSLF